jgi:hypothetical protein
MGYPTIEEVSEMAKVVAEYDVKRDDRKRITLRRPKFEYYHAIEYADGRVLLEPRELRVPDTISRHTWNAIESGIHNLDQGLVGDEFELDELQDLLNEP